MKTKEHKQRRQAPLQNLRIEPLKDEVLASINGGCSGMPFSCGCRDQIL
jgi:hypothetical protein